MIEHIHPDGEPTPTARDLYDRKDGSVEVVDWSTPKGSKTPQPSKYRLTSKGQAVLASVMRRNAEGTLARGTATEEAVERLKRATAERDKGGKGNGGKSTRSPS